MSGPSDHLSWRELACKDGTPYPNAYVVDERVFKLAKAFEDIRRIWDRPIIVVSAYRTSAWNRQVGGARNSQHLHGRALDLLPPRGVALREFYEVIRDEANLFKITGIGLYTTFVHIDTRPGTRLAVWRGTGVKDTRS